MDRRLHLIDHLYGEADADTPPLAELLRDPALKDEYRSLSEARFALDRRSRPRPDQAAIDAIVDRARTASTDGAASSRRDRRPVPGLRRYRRMAAPALALAAALALTLWIAPWSARAPGEGEAPAFADAARPESVLQSLPPGPSLQAAAATPEPGVWDQGRDIRQIARRIEALKASGELSWDEPAVPLELLPRGSGDLTPASGRH